MGTLKSIYSKVASLKKVTLLLLGILLSLGFSYAQKGSISGVVIDGEVDDVLIGATVVITGTQNAVITDLDGRYEFRSLDAGKYEIEVVYVGFQKEKKAVTVTAGSASTLDFRLGSATHLGEVVVTALGIKREEKSLGYAVSQVSSEDLNKTVSSNWLSGMSGKVAGLNFDQSSAGPGGSIRVTLRGEGSLSHGKNTALFVVDGVPIGSDMQSNVSAGSYSSNDSPIDYGNGASDLNPEDIESVSVLKGPAATALYGSRAANGAIIITTKSGGKTNGIGVSINSSVTFENAGYWPKFQNQYGAGDFKKATTSQVDPSVYSVWTVRDEYDNLLAERNWSRMAFGHPLDGRPAYLYSSKNWETGEFTPQPFTGQDWYKGFFDTGVTYSNSVTLSGGNTKGGSVRLSIKDTRNDWIVPNTGYNSQNISLSASHKISDYLKIGGRVTYYRKNSDNLPVSGYNQNSPLYVLIWSPVSTSINDYYQEYMNRRVDMVYESGISKTNLVNSYSDNPYTQVYEHLNTMARDRVYGSLDAEFTLIPKKLKLMLRTGMDFMSDFRTQRKPYYSNRAPEGFYREQNLSNFEMNNDFLLSYTDKFGDFDLNASFGGNNMYNRTQNTSDAAARLFEKNIYMLNNSADVLTSTNTRYQKAINSFYGFASIGWKSMLYLELTARNDWSSTLPSVNRSYFYPSVNTSILLNEVFKLREKASWLDMAKIRASWANVGNDTDPYQLQQAYTNSSFPAAYRLAGALKNSELKPENVENWEFGLETKMFKNRFGFDLTYYYASTTDQIINIPSDWSTGASSRWINAGEVVNKGVEIAVHGQPISTKDWTWNVNFNWAKNWNKLVSLAPDVEMWQLNSSNTIGGRVFIYAYPGTELGRIYGGGYERAPEGAFYTDANGNKVDASNQVIVDANGSPVLTNELIDHGSIYPKWTGGFNQSISWRDLTLSMSFAFQYGGKAYSVTNFALSYLGKLENSLEGRYDGLVHEGVNYNPTDGTYTQNTTITKDIVEYYNMRVWNRENVENNVFSTSYLKMKELRLDYNLPRKVLKKVKLDFIQSLQIGGYATNIFTISNWPQYDPEVASLSGSSLNRGVETGGYPMTRTFGFNVKVNF